MDKLKLLLNKGITSFISSGWKYLNAKTKGLPHTIMIEPTQKCNLNCTICYTQKCPNKRNQDFMSFGQFKKIIDEIEYHTVYINFWFAGEPLLNKDLGGMVEYANRKDIITCVSTNATLLNEHIAKELITAKLDKLIISFDGATKETYEKIRVGANFDNVKENIKRMTSMKKDRPFVTLQLVVTKENEHELDKFEQLAKDLNADGAYLKSLYTFDPGDKEIKDKIKSLVPSKPFQRSKERFCTADFRSVILSDGRVIPCCMDVEQTHVFGNVFDKSFEEIWNSKKYKYFRKDQTRFYKDPLCKSCGCNKDYTIKKLK